jgi:hypothetical protein
VHYFSIDQGQLRGALGLKVSSGKRVEQVKGLKIQIELNNPWSNFKTI